MYKLLQNLVLLDSNLLIIDYDKKCVKKIHMLRWRNWGLKYVGVQDRALKICSAPGLPSKRPQNQPSKDDQP